MNGITVTKNTTPGSEAWDVEYTADQAATVAKTMDTGGTVMDRDIHIEVTVPTGTEGTPIATKGAVSGNAVSVTPSVTNSAGFISGNTITGTSVSVSASELVSGTKSITSTATTDVTNYASAAVSDANLVAGNIKDGVSILGVTGDYTGSGGPVEEKAVNFIDYDGTLLYSYTTTEFAALSALPPNPAHPGLTAQGWNWELAAAKTYVSTYGGLWVGQNYITDDGKTHVYVEVPAGATPMVGLGINGTVVLDWGDGSATETLTASSLSSVKWSSRHTYVAAGEYVITLICTSGTFAFLGASATETNGSYLLRYSSRADNVNYAYGRYVRRIELGLGAALRGAYGLTHLQGLQSITIPNANTLGLNYIGQYQFYCCKALSAFVLPNLSSTLSVATYAFAYCSLLSLVALPQRSITFTDYGFAYSSIRSISIPTGTTWSGTLLYSCYYLRDVFGPLSSWSGLFASCHQYAKPVIIPEGVTDLGVTGTFSSCYLLPSVTFPSTLTTINRQCVANCYSLMSLTVPANVASLSASCFTNCLVLKELHFQPATPPTVQNANSFTNLPTTCKIYVPAGKLSAYTSAANYPSSSTYTYIEE